MQDNAKGRQDDCYFQPHLSCTQFAATSDFIMFSICNLMSGSAAFFAAVCSQIVPATRRTYGWYSLKDLILFKDLGVGDIFYLLTAIYLSRYFLTDLALSVYLVKGLSCPLEWDCLLAVVPTKILRGFENQYFPVLLWE